MTVQCDIVPVLHEKNGLIQATLSWF